MNTTEHHPDRRAAITGTLCLLAQPTAAAAQETAVSGVRDDGGGRLTTPVSLNGGWPLRFAVDSAANASVIASDLLEPLGLTISGTAEVNTLIARETVQVTAVNHIDAGAVARDDTRLMVADRSGLGGVDGLLGTDVLAGSRLIMQFERRRMRIARSRTSGGYMFSEGRSQLRYRAPAEQRFTNLMMIEGMAGSIPFRAILDTGARISIINRVMAEAIGARPIVLNSGRRTQDVLSPTGLSQQAEAMMASHIGFAGVSLRQTPVLVGDFHVFDLWGLSRQPAMLMGVDILGRFRTVSIDLKRGELLLET